MSEVGEKNFLYNLNRERVQKADNESFQQEKFEQIKPDRTKYFWIAGIVVVALIGLYFLLNQKITVQDMTGWTVTQAETWATNNGIQLIEKTMYSDTVDQDGIISQDTEAGTQISKNTTLNVVVSLGPDPDAPVTLADFDTDWTKAEILAWIKENFLTNYKFTTKEDDSVDPNLFVSYDIGDVSEDAFKRSDAITFVVTAAVSDDEDSTDTIGTTTGGTTSSGSSMSGTAAGSAMTGSTAAGGNATVTVNVPDFSMMSQSQITQWAAENSIQLTISTAYSETVPGGKLISQSRRSGMTIAQGQSMTVVYSAGSTVPLTSFVGRSQLEFQQWVSEQNAKGAHLSVITSYQASSKVAEGCIVSQSVMNAEVPLSQTIQVIISTGAIIQVPDFTAYDTYDAMLTYKNIVDDSEKNNWNVRISFVTVSDPAQVGKVQSQSSAAGTIQSQTVFIDVVIGQ